MRNKLIVGLSVVLLSLVVTYVWFNIEPYEEIVLGPWSDEARKNPFLAAEQFLDQRDIATESSTELFSLDNLSTNSLLIIRNANLVLSKSRVDALEQWMQRGGHVIVAAQLFNDDSDILLSRFDVTKDPYYFDDVYEEDTDGELQLDPELKDIESQLDDVIKEELSGGEEPGESASTEEESFVDRLQEFTEEQRELQERADLKKQAIEQGLTVSETLRRKESRLINGNVSEFGFDSVDYQLHVDFTDSGSLSHPYFYWDESEDYVGYKPFLWQGNGVAVGLLQIYVGDGLLTVLSDLDIWNSAKIGDFDHAFLLELMAEDADKVWFLYGASAPGILTLLWQNFLEMCIAFLALLGACFIYSSRRFGAIRNEVELNRRAFKEHVQAAGNYFWTQKMHGSMLNNVREDIWLNMRKRDANFDKYNQQQKIDVLKKFTQLSEPVLQSLMFGEIPTDEIRFFQAVKSLQKIRKML